MSRVVASENTSWYAAYPEAVSVPRTMTRSELLLMMKTGETPGKDFVLVDLRRNDHEGGTISGSINLPAQSLYPTIPALYTMLQAAQIPRIIWYCGSSRGRGNRAAAWFADYVRDHQGDGKAIESIVLLEGIKGWVGAGSDFTAMMEEYNADVWEKS